jgi:hypothetical protein
MKGGKKMPKVKKISENIIEFDGEKYVKQESIEGEWLKIPELNIEVEINIHDKNKSWDDLGLKNREKELLTIEQCIFLANSKYAKTLKMDGSSSNDDFFIQQPLNLNRKNNYVAQFYSDSDGSVFGLLGDAVSSGSTLGVRFVRPLKKKK